MGLHRDLRGHFAGRPIPEHAQPFLGLRGCPALLNLPGLVERTKSIIETPLGNFCATLEFLWTKMRSLDFLKLKSLRLEKLVPYRTVTGGCTHLPPSWYSDPQIAQPDLLGYCHFLSLSRTGTAPDPPEPHAGEYSYWKRHQVKDSLCPIVKGPFWYC